MKRKKYKTERGEITAYYWKNKEKIDKEFGGLSVTPLKAFLARVRAKKEDKRLTAVKGSELTTKEAIRAEMNSEDFTSTADRLKNNALSAIKGDKDAMLALRRSTGWKSKVEASNLRWDPDEHAYVYEGPQGKVLVDFTNSPKSVRVTPIHTNKVTGKTIKVIGKSRG